MAYPHLAKEGRWYFLSISEVQDQMQHISTSIYAIEQLQVYQVVQMCKHGELLPYAPGSVPVMEVFATTRSVSLSAAQELGRLPEDSKSNFEHHCKQQ